MDLIPVLFGCVLLVVAVVCLVLYFLNARVYATLDRLFEGDVAKRKYFIGLVLRSPYLRRPRSILRCIGRARIDNLDHSVLRSCDLDPSDQKTVLLYYLVALRGTYVPPG